jgi:Fur family transcriptional regulator, ferric uptake regulator
MGIVLVNVPRETQNVPSRETRNTEQREAIEEALRRADRPLSAQELFVALREAERKVGLATVYRNLNRLTAEGIADSIRTDSGEQAFLWCGEGHHHHLACRVCGRVEEIRDCSGLDEWSRRVARRHRFTAVEHRAEVIGVCGACSE